MSPPTSDVTTHPSIAHLFQGDDSVPHPMLRISLSEVVAAGGHRTASYRTASGPSTKEASGPSSLLGTGPSRKEIDNLVQQIFREEVGAGGSNSHVGSSVSGTVSSGATMHQQSFGRAEEDTPFPQTSIPPPRLPDNTRREIQRQMEDLREELRDGQSQWEVQEQIGKGGFGVVYKVGGGSSEV